MTGPEREIPPSPDDGLPVVGVALIWTAAFVVLSFALYFACR